ncbi:hypothetical protein IFM89_032445 [Coptis chinensis]|uniref:DNA-directed RNA polymerase III subunit RPC5 n=1 Tax=Coptis chinensis TaxID=261450 RepID=A0A835I4I7_9MAGN|nr:hypothetical protein IFM89_032445 [Coptis chinensis]
MELDLDDLGLNDTETTKPTLRPKSRFQPKSVKLMPKPEPQLDTPPSSSSSSDHASTKPLIEIENKPHVSTKEELDTQMMDKDNEEEEEDIVVREIDVYFTPSPLDNNTQLYVMQYPLRPSWRPYELNEKCQKVRVKPESGKVEVELSVDNNSNYDDAAVDVPMITKQTLSSSRPPLTTSYAVGVLMGNKLHLNPVHAVVQLRPSMEHLKSGGSNEITEVKAIGSSKQHGKLVKSSTEQVTDVEESWIPLDYYGMDNNANSLSTRYRQKMTSQESFEIQFSMSSYGYVNSLCPGSTTDNDRYRILKRSLLSLPLAEKFKRWFLEGPPLNRFNALKHLAPDDSNEDVLEVLQRHACVVQGLWVARSSLLELKGDDAIARDYILYSFNNDIVIRFKQLDDYYQRFKEAFSRYLKHFAVHRAHCEDWKLKEAADATFVKHYPNIVKQQKEAWEKQEPTILDNIKPRTTKTARLAKSKIPKNSVIGDHGVKTGVNSIPSSGPMTVPDATQEAQENIRSLQLKQTGLKAGGRGVRGADSGQASVNIHGVFVPKSSGNANLDPIRGVVIDLFCAKEPDAKLKKAEIVEAAKIQLKRTIDDKELKPVLKQLCVSKGGSWVLRKGDGDPKLYNLDIPDDSNFQLFKNSRKTENNARIYRYRRLSGESRSLALVMVQSRQLGGPLDINNA